MYSLMDTWGFPCEFPHSEISGSQAICAYPKLIAAYHVLHRLLMPRHSPYALCSLTYYLKPLSISLAATKKIDFSFSSSRYLDVSVPWVTFIKLCIHLMIHGVSHVSFLIRRSPDLRLFAPTRSLSLLITSFIGS